jgi:hypothetical protein
MWKSKIKSNIYIIGMVVGLVLIGTLFIFPSMPSTYSTPSAARPAPVTMPPMTSTQTMRSSSCPTMSSMSTDGMNKMNPIIQNATTADYKIELGIGPTANMLMMCQVTSSTTSGEVMVASQMSPMSMTGNTYHLELHVYNINTGAAEVVPINSVGITVPNSSGTTTTIPVAEMFDIGQGPTDFHYGNNVQLTAGTYTVDSNIGSENASFNVTISAMSPGMSTGMSMK